MRALVCRALSEDLSGVAVEEVAQPAPGPGEVLVRVRAAALNFPDVLMCQGRYQLKPPLPFTPGLDLAGEIAALGKGVSGLKIEEAVTAGVRLGALAEYVAVPADSVRPKPASLDWPQAAALGAAYLTAYVALVRRARLQPGETILVLGAAGGVGLACADLGKRLGARVIAAASTPEKRAFLEAYGADLVVPAGGFREAVLAATAGQGADVIVDPVGGDAFDESVRCIAFDGRLLTVGFASGRIPTLSANIALIKGFSLIGVRAGEYGRRFPERGRENLDAVARLAAEGKLRPHVGRIFALNQAREALDLLKNRAAIGKIVVTP